ncbi:uncharacterized protein BDV14DRAFT_168925 [Aspergillus stella-maris]|uniref:uncharacterized protein n=1 Tax=Aspergillus stella-maris TaxID=1810926 RepID=UPI003CCE0BFC
MSSGLPYLQKLRKAHLAELAELTALQDYEDDNKPDLAIKLDQHLQANSTIFSNEKSLEDYYRRTGSPVKRGSRGGRGSASASVETPVKAESASSNVGTVSRSARRRQTQAREVSGPDAVPASAPSQPLIDVAVRSPEAVTPAQPLLESARRTVSQSTPSGPLVEVADYSRRLPPSPAVVTEAIERQTTAWAQTIGEAWEGSGVQERTNSLRETLSSVEAVEVIVTLLEAFSLIKQVLPLRYLATFPAIDAINTPALPIKIPDLFVLVDSSFWAPVSLWLLTSVFLPLSVAYFFNISLRVSQSNASGVQTRRSSLNNRVNQTTFDPLSFNIAKAIVTYLVYAHGFTFWNIWGSESLLTVDASIPFQYAGVLTGTAIGAVGTLYEAILRK